MKLKTNICTEEIEVDTYTNPNGNLGIKSSSLINAIKQLPEEIGATYNVDIITATPTFVVVKATVVDMSGHKSMVIADVVVNEMDRQKLFQDAKQEGFIKSHPVTFVATNALDEAIRQYFGWPKEIMSGDTDKYDGTSTINDDVNIPEDDYGPAPFIEDVPSLSEEVNEDAIEPMVEEPVIKPEPVSDTDDTSTAQTEELDTEAMEARIKELENKVIPGKGKTAGQIFKDVWKNNPSWFNFILEKNSSNTYDEVREYATLMKKLNK